MTAHSANGLGLLRIPPVPPKEIEALSCVVLGSPDLTNAAVAVNKAGVGMSITAIDVWVQSRDETSGSPRGSGLANARKSESPRIRVNRGPEKRNPSQRGSLAARPRPPRGLLNA